MNEDGGVCGVDELVFDGEAPLLHDPLSAQKQQQQQQQQSATAFFDEYVVPRRPCKLLGKLNGARFYQWTLESISQACGEQEVTIEHRAGESTGFGKGHRLRVQLKHFLDKVQQGDSRFYLSTQPRDRVAGEDVAALDPMLTKLSKDYPLVPPFLSKLELSTCNIWIGQSKKGSSSGLHHDFHDNLYVVLKGRKKFRLFPPSLAPRMYTHGDVEEVQPNGYILYKQLDASAKLASLKKKEDIALRELEAAQKTGDRKAQLRAEAEIDRIMNEMLDVAQEGGDPNDDGDDGDPFPGMSDDYDDDDGDDDDDVGSFQSAEEELQLSDVGDDVEQQRLTDEGTAPFVDSLEDIEDAIATFPAKDTPPQSFSKVVLPFDEARDRRAFPDFPASEMLTCTIGEGEMLFLPTGWFHEVTSIDAATSDNDSDNADSAGPHYHMAFNYWFHAPENSMLPGADAHSTLPFKRHKH